MLLAWKCRGGGEGFGKVIGGRGDLAEITRNVITPKFRIDILNDLCWYINMYQYFSVLYIKVKRVTMPPLARRFDFCAVQRWLEFNMAASEGNHGPLHSHYNNCENWCVSAWKYTICTLTWLPILRTDCKIRWRWQNVLSWFFKLCAWWEFFISCC